MLPWVVRRLRAIVVLIPRDGEHRLCLCGRVARRPARALDAGGRRGAPGAIDQSNDPGGAVVNVEAVQHGEPVLYQPAHRATPGVLCDPARLALKHQHRTARAMYDAVSRSSSRTSLSLLETPQPGAHRPLRRSPCCRRRILREMHAWSAGSSIARADVSGVTLSD